MKSESSLRDHRNSLKPLIDRNREVVKTSEPRQNMLLHEDYEQVVVTKGRNGRKEVAEPGAEGEWPLPRLRSSFAGGIRRGVNWDGFDHKPSRIDFYAHRAADLKASLREPPTGQT
jgi:hypothetical protein